MAVRPSAAETIAISPDAGLPGLRILSMESRLRDWLERHGVRVAGRAPVRIEPLKLRPGRRLSARLRLGARTFYIKVYRPSRVKGIARRYGLLALRLKDKPPLVLPEMVAADRKRGIVLWRAFSGRPLVVENKRASGLASGLAFMRQAGRALASVHATRIPLGRTWSGADEMAMLRERVVGAPPWMRSLLPELASRLGRATGRSTVHRDFYPEQVLVGRTSGRRAARIAFLDWDDAALGPPALDVGNFLAHLRLTTIRSPRLGALLPRMRRAFLDGYGHAHVRSQMAWDDWEAAALLRLSALAWSRHAGRDAVRRARVTLSEISAEEEARLIADAAKERLGLGGRG